MYIWLLARIYVCGRDVDLKDHRPNLFANLLRSINDSAVIPFLEQLG